MRLLERALFALLLITLPIQLGKHFWPYFSFVQGIRVDYLSPTLYVSDIAFLLLFLSSIYRLRKQLFKFLQNKLFLFTIAILLVGGALSFQPFAFLFGFIKFLEFGYIAFYVAVSFGQNEKELSVFVLSLWAVVQTLILFFQSIGQHSLNGIFYFLGERTFTEATIGIATVHWNNMFLLRPYGTFPHPNVVAFYLLVSFILLLGSVKLGRNFTTYVKLIALAAILIGIVLTFSRVVLLLAIGISLWQTAGLQFKRKSTRTTFLGIYIPILLLMLAIFLQRVSESILRDSMLRWELIVISIKVFLKNPFVGVGLNNFYYHEISYQKNITPILLQPVHNIYLLWLSQTGILGFFALFSFFHKAAKKVSKSTIMLSLSLLVVGLFDHYLITLQQGQLLAAIILGLIFAREEST